MKHLVPPRGQSTLVPPQPCHQQGCKKLAQGSKKGKSNLKNGAETIKKLVILTKRPTPYGNRGGSSLTGDPKFLREMLRCAGGSALHTTTQRCGL